MTLRYSFQIFGTVPLCRLHYKRFHLHGPGRDIQWDCPSQCIQFGMQDTLVAALFHVISNVLSFYDLYEV